MVPSRIATFIPSRGISMRPRTSPSLATVRDGLALCCSSALICCSKGVVCGFLIELCMKQSQRDIRDRKSTGDEEESPRPAKEQTASHCEPLVLNDRFMVGSPLPAALGTIQRHGVPGPSANRQASTACALAFTSNGAISSILRCNRRDIGQSVLIANIASDLLAN